MSKFKKRYAGGYSPADGTVEFYTRINRLVTPDSTVLDLGAGRAEWNDEGRNDYHRSLRYFRGRVKKVIAADVDPVVKENVTADETVIIEDGKLALEDQVADVIIADWVLEHIEDPAAFASEVDRLLKPGGWFCARTPHKLGYMPLASRMIPNSLHASVIKKVQPGGREAHDVFPTRYRMNSIGDCRRAFPAYTDYSYVYIQEPAYYFGNKILYQVFKAVHKLAPAWFSGSLLAFMQKPE